MDTNNFIKEADQIKTKIANLNNSLNDDLIVFNSDLGDIENELQYIRNTYVIKPPLASIKPVQIHSSVNSKSSELENDIIDDMFNQYELLSVSDIIMATLAGMAGVATSWALRYEKFGAHKIKDNSLVSNGGVLADIHDGNYRKNLNPTLYKIQEIFEHPNNPFDKLEGAFHRLRYGHDIFNWNQVAPDGTKLWAEMIEKHGGIDVLPFGNINKFLSLLNTVGST